MGTENDRTILLNQDLRKELEERFRPELINRIDHTCVFQPLKDDVLHKIAQKQIDELIARLLDQGLTLDVHKAIIPHIVKLSDASYGARNIRQHIQTEIEHKIAERLTKSDSPSTLSIKLRGKQIQVTKKRKA